jgi:hypothetical protein
MLQIMNKEEDREKPYNPCKPMRLKKGNKKRMISIWFFESSSVKKKFQNHKQPISRRCMRLLATKISDPVKKNKTKQNKQRSRFFVESVYLMEKELSEAAVKRVEFE